MASGALVVAVAVLVVTLPAGRRLNLLNAIPWWVRRGDVGWAAFLVVAGLCLSTALAGPARGRRIADGRSPGPPGGPTRVPMLVIAALAVPFLQGPETSGPATGT